MAVDRFASRAHLAGLARGHRPTQPVASVIGSLSAHVAQVWAASIGVEPDDLVLFGSGGEAVRTLTSALVAPGDVVLLGEPAEVALPAAVLAVGGRYLDIGRDQRGRLPIGALRRAAELHVDAVLWASTPALTGADDCDGLPADVDLRAVLADERLSSTLNGRGLRAQSRALAQVIALRDVDRPADPVLYAAVCRPGTGWALAAVRGPGPLPLGTLQGALATLGANDAAGPQKRAALEAALDDAAADVTAAVAEIAGAQALPRAGVAMAVECLAGNAGEVATLLSRSGWSCAPYGPHPMRSLLVVDLFEPGVSS